METLGLSLRQVEALAHGEVVGVPVATPDSRSGGPGELDAEGPEGLNLHQGLGLSHGRGGVAWG